jgi:hypothetical protein
MSAYQEFIFEGKKLRCCFDDRGVATLEEWIHDRFGRKYWRVIPHTWRRREFRMRALVGRRKYK